MSLEEKLKNDGGTEDFESKTIRENGLPKIEGENPRLGVLGPTAINSVFSNKDAIEGYIKYCDETDVDAILATGDFLAIDTRKYSKLKPARAGMKEDIEVEVPYPEEVEEVLGDEEPAYVTFRRRLKSLEHKLEDAFEGNETPIYITFGSYEEDLYQAISNEKVRERKRKDRHKLKNKINEKENELKAKRERVKELIKKREKLEDEDAPRGEKISVAQRINYRKDDINNLEDEIGELEAYRDKAIMTNVRNKLLKEFNDEAKAYVAQILEDSIPNSRVISEGLGEVELEDGKKVKFKNNFLYTPNPKKTAVDRFKKELSSRLSKNKDTLLWIQGGLHGVQHFAAVRINGEASNWENLRRPVVPIFKKDNYTYFAQAPPLMNKEKGEEVSSRRDSNAGEDIIRMFRKVDVATGAMAFDIKKVGEGYVVKNEWLTEDYLKNLNKGEAEVDPETFWVEERGDHHIGLRNAMPRKGSDPTWEVYIKKKPEIFEEVVGDQPAMLFNLGDTLQGRGWEGYDRLKEREAKTIPLHAVGAVLHKAKEVLSEKEYSEFNRRERKMRQTYNVNYQQKEWERVVLPEGHLEDILGKHDELGMRDPAMVFVVGNHEDKSLEGYNPIQHFADLTRVLHTEGSKLATYKVKKEEGEEKIICPEFGQIYPFNHKRIGVKGHHKYKYKARHKIASTRFWNTPRKLYDNLQKQLPSEDEMVSAGHTHHFEQAAIGDTVITLIPTLGQEHTSYGNMYNLSAPTIGALAKGLPYDGPDKGPVQIVPILSDTINSFAEGTDWFEKGQEVYGELETN